MHYAVGMKLLVTFIILFLKKYGGTDSHDNLIIVCPNCHRKIHTLNIYNEDFLRQYSIDKTFENWKDFYHISN